MRTMDAPLADFAPRQVKVGVDEHRLLAQAGQLFGSATEAFAELVQNAYRGGATELAVTADPTTRTVTFFDNGRGCDDPSNLFMLARSGWNEANVCAAAGMGAFALFALSTHVTVRSFPEDAPAWQCTFGRDALSTGVVTVVPFERTPTDPAHGFAVTATLDATVVFPDVRIVETNDWRNTPLAEWRHFFPLTLTLTTPDGTVTLAPELTQPAGFVVPTAVGTVIIGPERRRFDNGEFTARWEHRRAGVLSFETLALGALIAEGSALEEALKHRSVTWLVDPTSGVRPKLPDRDTLIRDQAFVDAMATIAAALVAAADFPTIYTALRTALGDQRLVQASWWHCEDIETLTVLTIPLSVIRSASFFTALGFQQQSVTPLEGTQVSFTYDSHDGLSCDLDTNTMAWWVKPAFACAAPEIAVMLGLPARGLTDATPVLPRLTLVADRMRYLPSLKMVAAEGLRLAHADGGVAARVPCAVYLGSEGDDADTLAEYGLDTAALAASMDTVRHILPTDVCVRGIIPVDSLDSLMAEFSRHAGFDGYVRTAMSDDDCGGCTFYDFTIGSGDDTELDDAQLLAAMLELVGQDIGGAVAAAAKRALVVHDIATFSASLRRAAGDWAQLAERATEVGLTDSELATGHTALAAAVMFGAEWSPPR